VLVLVLVLAVGGWRLAVGGGGWGGEGGFIESASGGFGFLGSSRRIKS
jgi:hypothetical protein